MDSTNGQCSLFLCPRQHDFSFDDDSVLISVLQEAGFISEKINTQDTNNRYLTGDNFLNYVAYMGCAPAIKFEASEDSSNFCFIQLHHYDSAKLIQDNKQSRAPHCPHCSKPVRDWKNDSTPTTVFAFLPMLTISGILVQFMKIIPIR